MSTIITRAAAAAIAFAALCGPALAGDGKKDCTTEPKEKWKPAAEAEAAAKAAGYAVSKSKIEGACYEVYGAKDGKNFELFYNPMTLKLEMTVAK